MPNDEIEIFRLDDGRLAKGYVSSVVPTVSTDLVLLYFESELVDRLLWLIFSWRNVVWRNMG